MSLLETFHKAVGHLSDMDELSIVPVEVLSMICKQGGVKSMQSIAGTSGNSHLHEAWQLAVTRLTTPSDHEFSLRDVQHIKKFRNLEHIAATWPHNPSFRLLSVWQLFSGVTQALSKLRGIDLNGPSSFQLLHALRGSQMQQRITEMKIQDNSYVMTADDFYCLAGMKALAQLTLKCEALPYRDTSDDVGMASQALAKTLESLSLELRNCPSPAAVQAFPGSMTSLQKLQLRCDDLWEGERDRVFAAAVSALVGLQDLRLWSVGCWTAQQQQQILRGMTCLTRLELDRWKEYCEEPLVIMPSVATLQELRVEHIYIKGAAADAVFDMAALRVLAACSLEPSVAWRGQVAVNCGIQELYLSGAVREDEALRNIPLLPQLRTFHLGPSGSWRQPLAASGGRYLHLARLLQRHAANLQVLSVSTDDEFREVLPDLPVCKKLQLDYQCIGVESLRVLSDTRMPVLEELHMRVYYGPEEEVEVAQLELGWLACLPALRQVEIMGGDGDQEWVRVLVRSLLESKPWVVVS